MKNTIKFLILLLSVSIGFSARGAEYVNLTINYNITGTQGGFDHMTKMRVYIDGNEAGDNTPKKQSLANSITVEVSKGNHSIKAVLLAKNENIWEERTIKNNYSLDCIYEKTVNFTADKSIDLVFDLKTLEVIDKSSKRTETSGISNKDNISTKSSVSENSKTALQKVNDYLKTFDNGYYGYLEVKDGYLYDRFKDGKNYCKALLKDIGKAEEAEYKRKVSLKCKSYNSCVYSTYTSSNHESFSFSQSSDFNTSELITLLNNLISSYNNTSGSADDFDKYKSNIDIMNSPNSGSKTEAQKVREQKVKDSKSKSNSDDDWIDEDFDELAKVAPKINTTSKTTTTAKYDSELKKLNDYLKTFDNGYYGYFEVKDGYIYDRFKAGKYNKFKMEDMEGAVIQEQYSRVIFKCKGDNKCIETDWKENGREEYTQFTKGSSYNYKELADLLNNFRDAYLGNTKQSTTKNNPSEKSIDFDKYKSNIDILNSGSTQTTAATTTKSGSSTQVNKTTAEALKELNDYMVTLDNGRYKGMEVTNGYIIQNYGGGQSSKAKIEDIDRVEINTEYNYAKLACKGDSKCVYSSITGSYHDYFNFNTAGKSLTKMETLLKNFLSAIKKTPVKTSSVSSTASTAPKSDAQKMREQKDKERQSNGSKTEDVDDFWGTLFEDVTPLEKSTTANPSKYTKPLNDLNAYLKTFNSATYGDVEVKGSDVIFNFKFSSQKYNSSIRITELVQNTIVIKGKSAGTAGSEEIKILCKNESKCFYSTYSKSTTDHFRFYSNTVKDLTKMEQLVNAFVNSLK